MMECATCKNSSSKVTLRTCAKCRTAWYCSRECQKKDWKVHKKVCSLQTGSASGTEAQNSSHAAGLSVEKAAELPTKLSPPKGLDQSIEKPFTRLDRGTWLHDRPERDVYRLLVESYRMRMEDDYAIDCDPNADSIYAGVKNPLPGFRRYMGLVKSRRDLLPSWWTSEKEKECERFGMDRANDNWYDLHCAIEKSDIIEHYGDSRFPMQLRMFAEAVYGRAPGGISGATIRKIIMSMESGDTRDDTVVSTLDLSGLRV